MDNFVDFYWSHLSAGITHKNAIVTLLPVSFIAEYPRF